MIYSGVLICFALQMNIIICIIDDKYTPKDNPVKILSYENSFCKERKTFFEGRFVNKCKYSNIYNI